MKNSKIINLAIFLICFSFTSITYSRENKVNLENRDRVFNWINNNLIGKTISKEKDSSTIANGAIEAVHAAKGMFSNPVKTELGFNFDNIWIVEQENYDLDKNKKRIGKSINKNRAGVTRTEVSVSKSTGELIGISRGLTNSITDITGAASRIKIKLEGDKLVINSHFVNYGDFFDKGGKYKPGGSISSNTFWVENDKLHLISKGTGYNLNPKNLEKLSISSTWESEYKEN